jgi:Tfp pilus assembly protein PilV
VIQCMTLSAPTRQRSRRRRGFALIDVIVGGILLAVGLAAILSLGARALNLHQRGEREVIAASLLDDLLGTVLAEGPEEFPDLHQMRGTCESPYEDFEFFVEIDEGNSGVPYKVSVTVQHSASGDTWTIETLIAAKLGEEEPPRSPTEPIDREGRYQEQEEAERND